MKKSPDHKQIVNLYQDTEISPIDIANDYSN